MKLVCLLVCFLVCNSDYLFVCLFVCFSVCGESKVGGSEQAGFTFEISFCLFLCLFHCHLSAVCVFRGPVSMVESLAPCKCVLGLWIFGERACYGEQVPCFLPMSHFLSGMWVVYLCICVLCIFGFVGFGERAG